MRVRCPPTSKVASKVVVPALILASGTASVSLAQDDDAGQLDTVTVTGSNDRPVVSQVEETAVEDGPAISGSFVGDDSDSDDDPASLRRVLDDAWEPEATFETNGALFESTIPETPARSRRSTTS